MKRPPNPGHLTIPVPNEIGVARTADELFALEYGDERAEEERRRYEAERACTRAALPGPTCGADAAGTAVRVRAQGGSSNPAS